MRTISVKLGDLNPHDDADCWFIWMHAVEEFLWPAASNDKDQTRNNQHPMFYSWCSELGDRSRVIEGVLNHIYPEDITLDLIYAKESERHSKTGKDDGLAIAVHLDQLWENAWNALLRHSESDGPPKPQGRQASRGLKFCLLILVLRLGVFEGVAPNNGRHSLVRWSVAVDAASLQLALSLYWQVTRDEAFKPPVLLWPDVKRMAAKKFSPSMESLGELKGHAESEGIDGYRKRLRATMDEPAFRKVAALAAEFERKGFSGLDKWRQDSGVSQWFECSKA